MQPIFRKIEQEIDQSFFIEHKKYEYFPNPLSFQPEIEILLVLKGSGTLFVGDYIGRFYPQTLVIIGPNVPHLWHSDEEYMKIKDHYSEVIYILFKAEIFGDRFWQMPEANKILSLFRKAERGIQLTGKTLDNVTKLMKSISTAAGFNRITLLFSILGLIESAEDSKFLSSPIIKNNINLNDSERFNKINQYVINNYNREITLKEAADISNFTPSAFCRYFRKRTNKTFIQFVNETRIAFACKSLQKENVSVEIVCYNCGFSNVSYFIKQFKKITGLTPLSYKEKFSVL